MMFFYKSLPSLKTISLEICCYCCYYGISRGAGVHRNWTPSNISKS